MRVARGSDHGEFGGCLAEGLVERGLIMMDFMHVCVVGQRASSMEMACYQINQ
jgi:hypothetical protein